MFDEGDGCFVGVGGGVRVVLEFVDLLVVYCSVIYEA